MAVRAVLFDLGDTLIFRAHEPDPKVLFTAMADRVQPLLDDWGVAPSRDLPVLLNEVHLAVQAAQPARRARGLEVDGAFIARGALATYGVEVSPEQAAEFWRRSALDHVTWGNQAHPDAVDTLRRLRDLSIPVALVSNNSYPSSAERDRLPSVGITEELLPVIVTSADLMLAKPDPAIYRRALEALSVTAKDAAFVGDDLECDVRGAKALGMTTVWKLNGRHELPAAAEADFAIHDLWELFTLGVLPDTSPMPDSAMPHDDDNADRY
jgi:HAD superfamily hydrolase (TIGR01509 family)